MTRATFDPPLVEFRPGVFAQEGDKLDSAGARWLFHDGAWEGNPAELVTPAWLQPLTGHDAELWEEWRHGKRRPRGYHATALGQLLEDEAEDLLNRPEVSPSEFLLDEGDW